MSTPLGKAKFRSWAIFLLAGVLALSLAGGAWAAYEDVAMFYEELAPYGNWVDYGNYGPVWYPSRVSENWRPYLDGRWVPTEGGWVFETPEPWGWATYHYGNWMPTPEYGWVWCPGRTWYPSTAAWRTSNDYIGWAPIPPPNYVPPPAYYPPGGYYPGISPLELITAPFWIFAQAVNFLLGFGSPFGPAYSYYNCGCLVPFATYPTIFPRTAFLYDFYYPAFAPGAYFFFGPSFPFVSRVCNIPIVRINTFVREVNVVRFKNVLPPAAVLERRPFLREALPKEVRQGRWQARRAEDPARVQRLARPDVARPPRDLPRVPKVERVAPGVREVPERLRPPVREPRPERARPEGFVPRERPRPEVRRPEVPERRGLHLPPQAVPEDRAVRDQLRQQRRLEQRQVPREQQRQFQRQEQDLRRQEIFRTPRGARPETPPPRMERQQLQPRQAPAVRQERQAAPRQAPPRGPGRSESPPERGR